jgi:xanthine dehydrogenase accessory factor
VIGPELSRRVDALRAARRPFALATVVRAQRPTSARCGDTGLVLADGTLEGFVGGACAEQSVRLHALRALETGESLLLRILPGDGEAAAADGAVSVRNPCLSGGGLEIFLEPIVPPPRVVVVGDTPLGRALVRLGGELDLDVVVTGEAAPEGLAVVVASLGRDELAPLRSSLEAGVPYVGLVASEVRGAAVAEELRAAGVAAERLAALDTPAGIAIGARTPAEIALAILARIVAVRRGAHARPPVGAEPATATDPVCGMTVAAVPATPHLSHGGDVVYFCGDGCRAAFERDPASFAAAR